MKAILATLTAAATLTLTAGLAQAQTQTVTYRMYLLDPDPGRVQQVVQAVDQALSSLGRIEKTVGMLPTPLPAAPGAPSYKLVQLGPFTQRVLDCDDAYARMHRTSDVSNPMGSTTESYTGCIYPTLAGTRVALVFNRSMGGRNFLGNIVAGITKAVEGDDAERARKITTDMLATLRKTLPELLVDLVELPGSGQERPDGAKVDERLAAVAPKPVSSAPSVGAAVANSTITAAIEARKQLTTMGLQYHDIGAFHDAIRRRDMIAVQLFVDAGAVAADAKGKDGLSAHEVAAGVGDKVMVELVRRPGR